MAERFANAMATKKAAAIPIQVHPRPVSDGSLSNSAPPPPAMTAIAAARRLAKAIAR